MRKWTMPACAVLAWCTLPLAAAAGLTGPGPSQANAGPPASSTTASTTTPATTSPAVTSPAVITPAVIGPADASPAVITVAVTSPAATTAAVIGPVGTTPAVITVAVTSRAASPAAPGTAAAAPVTPAARVTLAARVIPAGGQATARPAATPAAAAAPAPRAATWTVRPGDTLSAIAAALAVPGGWPALYAANRRAIGPDPGLIRPGTVLALPPAPARYTVAPGDTLSAIAAALAVPGGWPALYAANRRAIGPDPGLIRPGTVLALPPAPPARAHPRGTTAPAPPGQAPASSQPSSQPGSHPGSRPSSQPASRPGSQPGRVIAPGHILVPAGLPRWLEDLLITVGLLAAAAFATEPAVALARRRKAAGATPVAPPTPAPAAPPAPRTAPPTASSPAGRTRPAPADRPTLHRVPAAPDLARRAAQKARIILADHERLIVTYSIRDHTVYVLTPPGEDPRAVLCAARLVLPEDTYQDLAGHLGVPSAWPLE